MVEINKISSFYPQKERLWVQDLEIHPRVFSAMGRPTIGYLVYIY